MGALIMFPFYLAFAVLEFAARIVWAILVGLFHAGRFVWRVSRNTYLEDQRRLRAWEHRA